MAKIHICMYRPRGKLPAGLPKLAAFWDGRVAAKFLGSTYSTSRVKDAKRDTVYELVALPVYTAKDLDKLNIAPLKSARKAGPAPAVPPRPYRRNRLSPKAKPSKAIPTAAGVAA